MCARVGINPMDTEPNGVPKTAKSTSPAAEPDMRRSIMIMPIFSNENIAVHFGQKQSLRPNQENEGFVVT
jgi:hypothetical protein